MKINDVRELLEVGDQVETLWDDTPKPIWATIEYWYRGHRGWKLVVTMPDNSREIIGDGQIRRFKRYSWI